MQRIRLLRVLLPIFLIAFIIVIGLTLRTRPTRTGLPADLAKDTRAHAEGFTFSDLVAGKRRLMVQAKVGRVDNAGRFDVEEVQRVEIERENQPPLILTAARGAGAGPQGKRTMRLEGGVTVHDDDTGLDLAIPTVEIDQVTGVVRSVGDVTITGAVWKGNASALIYSLTGQPAEIIGVHVVGVDGAELSAHRAVVEPKSQTLTLDGDVDAKQGGMTLKAPIVVLVRGPKGKIESATASSQVSGSMTSSTSGAGTFSAREARANWAPDGKVRAVSLSGGAHVQHIRGEILADRIDAQAQDDGGWALDATGQAVVTGPTQKGTGKLTASTVRAHLGGDGEIKDGVATGDVTFDGDGTSGEAAQATFSGLGSEGEVTLRGAPERRARLANARTRVVADSIESDLKGTKMTAEGRVESTLLPAASSDRSGPQTPMFATDEAVHFVSTSLESTSSGARLLFRGDVRGWQGDRTLSADEVEMIQEGQILNATGSVVTRMPRVAGKAAGEADFIQVVADKLRYGGTAHAAEYNGSVRARQVEGWLEAPRLVVALLEGGHGVHDVQAYDGVRFEYRSLGGDKGAGKGTPTQATGEGDRAVYEAGEQLLRLFGDKGPATVRNTGPSGGTTVGRVLRYHLDTGALEVESGERDRATIKTPKS
ncbi:MAG TPA: LptA/OstA family protein [Candidatus Polarisedimenticolaceae bacterium]|nr:LptA/OstA family protein [Candidatus Polarisedimenticolaceae bacterium]